MTDSFKQPQIQLSTWTSDLYQNSLLFLEDVAAEDQQTQLMGTLQQPRQLAQQEMAQAKQLWAPRAL